MHTPATILLIDDEVSFVQGLARLLQRDGYTVHTAANGQQALAQLHTQRYDVILCDLRMPVLDGPSLSTLVQQHDPALRQRMIFVTGDTLGVESTAFLAQCGQPYLYKPCTAAAVRHAIHQVLGAVAATNPAASTPVPSHGKGVSPSCACAPYLSRCRPTFAPRRPRRPAARSLLLRSKNFRSIYYNL